MKSFISILVLVCLTSTIHCAPVNSVISSDGLEKDQVVNRELNALKSSNVEDTTPSNLQLFNNNESDENKMFKISDADELIETSNLLPSSKQASAGGMPNVQSLIDQTDTISKNLENMIKDMTTNRRHATAAMLKLILQNVKRLNTSLVRLNTRVNALPVVGSSPGSATASASSSSSVSNSVSNATINAAAQINSVVSSIRNQLNNVSNEINNLLQRIRLSVPTGGSKPANKPTPKP